MDPWDHSRQEPDDEDKLQDLLREDLVLSGVRLLSREFDRETLVSIGKVCKERLQEAFVMPDDIQSLHPEISVERAKSEALSLSLRLTIQKVDQDLENRTPIRHSDFDQVLGGTTLASREALAAIAYATGTRMNTIIDEALERRWERSECDVLDGISQTKSSAADHCLNTEYFGFGGKSLLSEDYEPAQLKEIGNVCKERLYEAFVSPSEVKCLNAAITDGTAEYEAFSLSLALVEEKIRDIPISVSRIYYSDYTQLFGGTRMASRVALLAIACATETTPDAIIDSALDRI